LKIGKAQEIIGKLLENRGKIGKSIELIGKLLSKLQTIKKHSKN